MKFHTPRLLEIILRFTVLCHDSTQLFVRCVSACTENNAGPTFLNQKLSMYSSRIFKRRTAWAFTSSCWVLSLKHYKGYLDLSIFFLTTINAACFQPLTCVFYWKKCDAHEQMHYSFNVCVRLHFCLKSNLASVLVNSLLLEKSSQLEKSSELY